MRGNKQPTSKEGSSFTSENCENMENKMDGVLRLGRFRLRLPSNKPRKMLTEGSVMDDLQSTSSASWSTRMEDHYNNKSRQPYSRPPSVIVQRQHHVEEANMYYQDSPSSALTIYHPPESLSEALGDWLQASETLLKSDEMHLFLTTTRHVVCSVGDLAVRTALFPVTLPLHVVCSTTELVLGGTVHIFTSAGSLIGSTIWSLTTGRSADHQERQPDDHSPTKRIEYDIDKQHYLERLRLDIDCHESEFSTIGRFAKSKTIRSTSEFLLRVGDIGVTTLDANGQEKKVFYVDLSSNCAPPDQLKTSTIQHALQRLFVTGVSLLSKHPTVRLTKHYPSDYTIDWKTEASTAKILRELARMSTLERLQKLQDSVLIWSGKFRDERNKNALPAFLARGIVQKSPRDFMMLLWDNKRTSEYNNYCVSRVDSLVLHDKILEGASEGAKVVQSETRVPYTSLTVKAKCLMHVRPLEAPDAGFVILSRSLDSGDAGIHFDESNFVHKASKNEILWGINIFREVPNHPHLTDLTSLSQVSSSLVPTFMANRIGLMGVEDFFKNVRASKE